MLPERGAVVVKEEEEKPQKMEIGQVVDVKKMLSSNVGDYLVSSKNGALVPMSSLDGKYILICSFTNPFTDHDLIFKSLEAFFSEPWNLLVLQIVLVFDHNNPSAFHSFFHTLSFNCLTIPFSDYNSRRRVCKSLSPHRLDNVSCLALNPSGRVLQNFPYFLYTYGSASFPFSEDTLELIRHRDLYIKSCLSNTTFPPITLEELLLCNSLPLLAHPYYFKPTSALYDRPVGLYLYYDGAYLHRFLDIHRQCLSKGLDFEFILVPLPFTARHPDYFVTLMKQSVLTSCPTSSWLTFPFNDKICRTLWRLYDCLPSDQLIIMPHAGRAGDLEGRSILRRYGIESYPFTTDVILEKKVTHLRSRTLESLLGDHHGLDIRNKNNVILYIVNTRPPVGYTKSPHEIIQRKTSKIKKLYSDTPLYTVPLVPASRHSLEKLGLKVVPEEKCGTIIDHIFMTKDLLCKEISRDTVVTFGKDGKVLSRFGNNDIDFLSLLPPPDLMTY